MTHRHTSATPAGVPRSRKRRGATITQSEWQEMATATFHGLVRTGMTEAKGRKLTEADRCDLRHIKRRVIEDAAIALTFGHLRKTSPSMKHVRLVYALLRDTIESHPWHAANERAMLRRMRRNANVQVWPADRGPEIRRRFAAIVRAERGRTRLSSPGLTTA